ncbi:insulinase family protein [Thalassotalea sp. LPB0316]|uniref:M16 family metallopeptidase n=1 Tax=Thalassotalea sp. LPB0316 TaxID=2769490 RepID=UPI00186682B2|nr:insulinase family protein [Thalassotalea sp. LPB0316]QOL24577.1 insulinase family protein [Thalassotalea sp. LPB0316]
MKYALLFIFLTVIQFILPAKGVSQGLTTLPDKVEFIRSINGVNEYKLANGIQILLVKDTNTKYVELDVIYHVGSMQEAPNQKGLAHLLEHLLHRTNRTDVTVAKTDLLKKNIESNATTRYEQTTYHHKFTISDEKVALVLQYEAERLINANFTDEALRLEKAIVLDELASRTSGTLWVILDALFKAAYPHSNYGYHVVGTKADVQALELANVNAFFNDYYHASNMTILVKGNFDDFATLTTIQQLFLKAPISEQPNTEHNHNHNQNQNQNSVNVTQSPNQAVSIAHHIDIYGSGNEQVLTLAFKLPTFNSKDYTKLTVLSEFYYRYVKQQLAELFPDEVPTISKQTLTDKQRTLFFLLITGNIDEAKKAQILQVLDHIDWQSIVASQAINIAVASFQVMNDREKSLQHYLALGDYRYAFYLKDERLGDYTFWTEDIYRKQDEQQLAKLALLMTHYFGNEHRITVSYNPSQSDNTREVRPQSKRDILARYDSSQYEKNDVNIDAPVRNEYLLQNEIETRVFNYQWPEGGELTFYQSPVAFKKFYLLQPISKVFDRKTFELIKRFDLLSLLETSQACEHFSESVSLMNDNYLLVEVNTAALAENIDAQDLRCLLSPVLAPSIDNKKFTAYIQQARDNHEYKKNTIAHSLGLQYLHQYSDNQLAQLSAISAEQVIKFLADNTDSFAQAHIIMSAGLVPDDVNQAVKNFFLENKLLARQKVEVNNTIEAKQQQQSGEQFTKTLYQANKLNSEINLSNRISLSRYHDDFIALKVATKLLGGGENTQLWRSLREDQGLTYYVQSQLYADNNDLVLLLTDVTTANENRQKVIDKYKETIAFISQNGFNADDFEVLKAQLLDDKVFETHEVHKALLESVMTKQPLFHQQNKEKAILAQLTLAKVNQVFNRYIAPLEPNIIILQAEPLANKKRLSMVNDGLIQSVS